MKHQRYRDMMELALLEELSELQLEELHKHLLDCEDCQAEYDRLNRFYKELDKIKPEETDDVLLQDARHSLKLSINREIAEQSFFEKIITGIKNLTYYYYKPALTAAFSIVIGLTLGYMFFHTGTSPESSFINASQLAQSETRITNVHFINPAVTGGEVEFTFDAVKPVRMKGSISDPKIQLILAQALINEKNPGTRISTVSALANHTSLNSPADPEIKSALISTLKYDSNPGVRRQALTALMNLPFDTQIKNTLIYILNNDKNSGLRIAAINGITSEIINGKKLDEETLKILKQKSQNDENEYVRIRAASLVKEAEL